MQYLCNDYSNNSNENTGKTIIFYIRKGCHLITELLITLIARAGLLDTKWKCSYISNVWKESGFPVSIPLD